MCTKGRATCGEPACIVLLSTPCSRRMTLCKCKGQRFDCWSFVAQKLLITQYFQSWVMYVYYLI